MITNKLLAKYLFEEATAKEKQKIEEWLEESEGNRRELATLRERIELATIHYRPDTFVAGRALKKMGHTLHKPSKLHSRFLYYATAAIFILCIGSGLLYYFQSRPVAIQTICSNAGQTIVVTLPDSTKVTLSGSSEISYPSGFGQAQRKVSMKGKIFFKVHRDPAHPFIVETPSIDVTVLGTSFQVSATENQGQVLVKQGKVAVSSPDGLLRDTLTAGMSADWQATDNQLVKSEEFDINLMAWKTKELRFNNTPLPEVIKALNSYYNAHIVLPENYKKLRLTATFKDVTLSKALEIINQTLDIHLTEIQ